MVHFQMLVSLPSHVRGSSADNAYVNIQWTQRDVQNDDKQRLVRLSEDFSDFLTHEPQKNDRQYKRYQTQYFVCTLQYKFQ